LDISERAVRKKATEKGWQCREEKNPAGGPCNRYSTASMDPETQKMLIEKSDRLPAAVLPQLSGEAAAAAALKLADSDLQAVQSADAGSWKNGRGIDLTVLRDRRVRRILRIVREALEVPAGSKKSKWIDQVAARNDLTRKSVYAYIRKFEKEGISGLKHTKGNFGTPKTWSPEALDWWLGLCLKRAHRKIGKDALYDILRSEAARCGWRIGGYRSAMWWYDKRVCPQLEALQRGGVRALDNVLPPVLRDYSDLAPFEILVGDQHRFDYWVIDDDSGEVFRPEGYFWQDLRTRCFYGGAADNRYDAYLCGLALRMGIRLFGAFSSIYTDNGKPELSRYIMGILADMRALGLSAERTVDLAADIEDGDETVNPCVILPGTHRKAIVKNAKAKMMERTFQSLEALLRDEIRLPGYCKRLTDSGEYQEIDQKEAQHLAAAGKLPTFREFVIAMYQAMDRYNNYKTHRGVLREWAWKPRPKAATPMDCLKACWLDGWRPRRLSAEAVDLVFLTRVNRGRVVDRGRVLLNNCQYEHDALVELHGRRVEVRFDPMDPEWVLVFLEEKFLCRATAVEYSSMKDRPLASRKIEEKRRRRKAFITRYRELTSRVPDFRQFGEPAVIEQNAELVRLAKEKTGKAETELYRARSTEELAAAVARQERLAEKPVPRADAGIPERPGWFMNDIDRYKWIVRCETAGGELTEEDRLFKTTYEAAMDGGQREYWQTVKQLGGLN